MAYGAILGQTPTASNVSYNNSQTSSIITGTNVQSAIDQLFTSVSNGKALIAGAITDMGVSTSSDATFQQMANNIGRIEASLNLPTGTYTSYRTIDYNNSTSIAGKKALYIFPATSDHPIYFCLTQYKYIFEFNYHYMSLSSTQIVTNSYTNSGNEFTIDFINNRLTSYYNSILMIAI